ncbi:hypothetical protein I8751_00845 [Nostocaceae cyanobacterium CENA357]|uniref:Uncharacterized protein n=1 Tax=Atlanticothrix silvestris CENA357 TaxID=1725252 RepID=A0A8J7KXV5_9CYAN|nr:hypothetical protein [Atlanticothrix silvestris]MBH8550959.1 hypothetical protein [Atlanticothrix silvestris CENA357]
MSLASCACCVAVLNQQHEQNISHQNQCQAVPVANSKSLVKNCTVVENGRVIVKPLQLSVNESSSEA